MMIDISKHPAFSAEDVSVAINAVVKSMKKGDSAFLEYGDYKIAGTIYISNDFRLDSNFISLKGNYEVINHNLDVTIKIDGTNYGFELENITSNDKSDYYNIDENDTLPGGISIGETNYAKLNFGVIEGFEFGIRLYPEGDYTGVNFTKITFDKIAYCCTPILFSMPDNLYCWINENQFYGGTIKGNYGIFFRKGGKQLDTYNNNTFYNIAFEAIEKHAIVADFYTYNTFIAPRFEIVNKLTIKESESCRCNKYLNSVSISFTSIHLESQYTSIDGPIYNNTWKVYLKKLYTDQNSKLHGEYYSRETQTADNTDKNIADNTGTVIVNSDKNPVTLTVTKSIELTDNCIILNVLKHKYPISVINEKKNTLIPENIITEGTYRLVYSNETWNLFRVSDTLLHISE